MSGRPPVLFPLFAGLETLEGIGPKTAKNLAQIGIERPRDLMFTLPASGIDRRKRATIKGVDFPSVVTVEVLIGAHRPAANRSGAYRIMVEDEQTSFQLVFFHARGAYLGNLLPTGQRRVISGKIEVFDGVAQMVHPDHVVLVEEADNIPLFEPVYPLTAGVTQKVMAKGVRSVLARLPDLGMD